MGAQNLLAAQLLSYFALLVCDCDISVVRPLLVQTIMRFLLTLLLSLVAVVSKVGVYATTPQIESIQS